MWKKGTFEPGGIPSIAIKSMAASPVDFGPDSAVRVRDSFRRCSLSMSRATGVQAERPTGLMRLAISRCNGDESRFAPYKAHPELKKF